MILGHFEWAAYLMRCKLAWAYAAMPATGVGDLSGLIAASCDAEFMQSMYLMSYCYLALQPVAC
jgi:hypothetical protein